MQNLKIEIKWAFIFMGSLLLWMLFERLVGLHDQHLDKHQSVTLFYAIIAIALYVFALRDKRANFYDGTMTYRQGVISGLVITLIVTLFSPLNQWIISTIITPHYFQNIIQYAVENGHIKTVAEAEAQFNLQTYMVQSTIGALIMGILTSVIVAFFVKKAPAGA